MIYIAKLMYGFGNISTIIIYVQAYHETGNFKSPIFKENNNLFGMRQAKVRKNFATGTNRGHATFKNLWDSVRDYFERQKNYRISKVNDEEFMTSTVKSGYAEDKTYLTVWKKLVLSVKSPVTFIYYGFLFFFLLFSYLIISSIKSTKKIK